jgi:predicted membrane protein
MKEETEFKQSAKLNFHSRHRRQDTLLSRSFTALIFIAAGVLLIGERTGTISYELFKDLFNWQMLIIGIGLVLISKKDRSIGGYIMILIGVIFLIPELIYINLNTRQLLWPAVLIGVGVIILFKGMSGFGKKKERQMAQVNIDDMDVLNDNHIFGGGEYYVHSSNFKGGKIQAIFGGGKYDLSKSKLAEGIQVLDVNMIFGGIELIVPADWQVKNQVDSILGGFSIKNDGFHRPDSEFSGQLIIKGSAIFGGGEIKRSFV